MGPTRRLRDFMSVGAKAFVSPTGRSAALAAASAVGMTFVSVAPASGVPVPAQRPAQASPGAPMTTLYDAFLSGSPSSAPVVATPVPGSQASVPVSPREAFVLRLRQAASDSAFPSPVPPERSSPARTLTERGADAGLGNVSLKLMADLHPDMQELLVRSREASAIPFEVVPRYGGKRTAGMQALLKKRGVAKTLLSKHILGLAFDIAPKTANGRLDFTDEAKLADLSKTVKAESEKMGLPVTWGGSWKFVDMFHFELPADWGRNAREQLVAENLPSEPRP